MCNYCEWLVSLITSLSLSFSPPTTGATKDMGKMLGGEEEKDPDAQKKEEERQEALRQQEEERKAKYAKMEAERENIRQGIRDKVKTLQHSYQKQQEHCLICRMQTVFAQFHRGNTTGTYCDLHQQ